MTTDLESAPADPDFTARISDATDDRRRATVAKALTRWRALVAAVADGQEPTGKVLGEIADVADALRLPTGALATDVLAVQRHRGCAAQVSEWQEKRLGLEARFAAVLAERTAAEETITRARNDLAKMEMIPQVLAGRIGDFDEVVRASPRMFADVDVVAAGIAAEVAR